MSKLAQVLCLQVETTPTQFSDHSVYLWNISNNGQLKKLEGFNAPPLRRNPHCADYATVRQQVGPLVAARLRQNPERSVQMTPTPTLTLNPTPLRWRKSRRLA